MPWVRSEGSAGDGQALLRLPGMGLNMDDARKLISKALELGFTVCVFDERRTVLNESRDYGEVVRAVEGLDQCLLHFNVIGRATCRSRSRRKSGRSC